MWTLALVLVTAAAVLVAACGFPLVLLVVMAAQSMCAAALGLAAATW
jgi:hypothetical protein